MRYAYDSEGYLQKIETDGTDYTFTYDNYGNLLTVKAGNYTLATNTYGPYDGAGRLIRAYRADADGAPLLQAENLYDAYGRAKSSTYVMPGKTMGYTLNYVEESSLLDSITLPGGEEAEYSYDSFDRLLQIKYPTSMVDFAYVTDTATKETSNLVASYHIWARYPESGMNSYQYALNYTYDANGNITEIRKGSELQNGYNYGSFGQLISERLPALDRMIQYGYDDAGNMIRKIPRSSSGGLLSDELQNFSYTNSTWGDLLTNYDGTTISYDASGNPTNWKGYSSLTWTGNRLTYATAESNGGPYTAMQYAYDANGVRTSKNYQRHVIGASYIDYYTVDGTKILSEKRIGGTNNTTQRTIYYVYDANGAVIGMEYNGTKYWYDKNLQGDVVGIRNASGTLVAQYVYDAWGNHRQITDGSGNDVSDNPNHIANINPFRYRGYYYDTETGWYYLNTRYYDPNVGRFLSPDTILGANGGLLGYNLYAYCNNNPVMFADPSGNFATALQNAIQAARDTLQATSANPQMSLIAAGSVLISGLIVALFGGDIADIVDDMKAQRAEREAKRAAEAAARELEIALEIAKAELNKVPDDYCIRVIINEKNLPQVYGVPIPIREAANATKNDVLAGTNIFIPEYENWGIYTPKSEDAFKYLMGAFGTAIYDERGLKHSPYPHYHIATHTFIHRGKTSNPHAWFSY